MTVGTFTHLSPSRSAALVRSGGSCKRDSRIRTLEKTATSAAVASGRLTRATSRSGNARLEPHRDLAPAVRLPRFLSTHS